MKAAAFVYERPADLNAALALMANADGMTKIIAGGQSLGPMLNLRLVEPDLIVDISGLSELKQAERSGDELVVGACITHGDIEDGRIPDVTRGAMQRVAGAIAYRAVRNRGTIGGSLSHADPAADWISALAALGAKVTLRSLAGTRNLAIEDFITGALESALRPGEIVEAVRVPAMTPSAKWGYVKACRKTGEFARRRGNNSDRCWRCGGAFWRACHRRLRPAIRCASSRRDPDEGGHRGRDRPAHSCRGAAPRHR